MIRLNERAPVIGALGLLWYECGQDFALFCYRVGCGAFTVFRSRSLDLEPGSPVMRPGFVHSHGRTLGWRNTGRQSWTWRSQNRWSRNGWFSNQGGFYGSGFWFSPYGFADAASGASGDAPVIVVGGPLNDFPAAVTENADRNSESGCVLHKLIYDESGKYVGERQTPEC